MKLIGELTIPGDKSISHRAILFNSIAHGKAKISNFLESDDTFATMTIMRQCGVEIEHRGTDVFVYGKGLKGLKEPSGPLNCLNSGTSARLLLGLLSGARFQSLLIGDSSLSKRPMRRVTKHLEKLGANIHLTNNDFLPAKIEPKELHGNEISLDVASAQVKSAVILAALYSKDQTIIHELSQTRNHTELMLQSLGADIVVSPLKIEVSGNKQLDASDLVVPGDISSAAFFIVAALIVPDSEVVIKNCGLNETRTGILQVLDTMGAHYEILNKRTSLNEASGDILIKYTNDLKPFQIRGDLIPLLIDEIPILTLLATQLDGISTIHDAKELRVKETDRIKACVNELSKLGADIIEYDDGMEIRGKTSLKPNEVETYGDHRMTMMLKITQLICPQLKIINPCESVSYPQFENDLFKLVK